MTFFQRSALGLITGLAAALITACMRPPVPPPAGVPCPIDYATESQRILGEGKADDGEDVINTAGGKAYGPTGALPASEIDGPANASSAAGAFNALKVKVTARKRATAGRRQPVTWARTIGTSAFAVRAPVMCQFEITSNATITVMGGTTRYKVRAEISGPTGAPVRGAAFEVHYEFRETPAGAIEVFTAENPGRPLRSLLRLAANPGAFPLPLTPPDLGPAGGFALDLGTYTVRYTLEAEGQAERQTVPPMVVVNIDVDAKFDISTFP